MMSAANCCGQPPAASPTGETDDILLIGLQGSGKTLLGQRLRTVYNKTPASVRLATTETNGSQDFRVPMYKGCPFKDIRIRECGGSMQPLWKNWYSKPIKGVLFTLDISDTSTLAAATVALYGVLQEPELLAKPVFLALTKTDLPFPMTRSELDLAMGLTELQRQYPERLMVAEVSAAQSPAECPALEGLLDWMAEVKAAELGLPLPDSGRPRASKAQARGGT